MKKRILTTGIAIAIASTNIVTSLAFTDVKDNHWAKTQIEEYSNRGILEGYEDGTFKPSQNITRAEFIKVMNKTFGINAYTSEFPKEKVAFNDIKGHWAEEEIMLGVSNGIFDYVLDNNLNKNFNFRPNDKITREEATTMIANYIKIKDSNINELLNFKDSDKVVYWAKDGLEGAIETTIIKGYEDNTIRPQGKLTRAEAVLMIDRAEVVKNNNIKPSSGGESTGEYTTPKFNIETSTVEEMVEYVAECGYTRYIPGKNWYIHEDSRQSADDYEEGILLDYGNVIVEDASHLKQYGVIFFNSPFDSPKTLNTAKKLFKPFFDDKTIDQIFEVYRQRRISGEFGSVNFNGIDVDIRSRSISILVYKQ